MMAPQTAPHKPDAEVVHKLIEALQNPDTPQRLAAIAARQADERKRQRRESYFYLCCNFGLIFLCVYLLWKMWLVNGGQSFWPAFGVGCVATVVLLLYAEKKQPGKSRPVSFLQVVVTLAIILGMNFLRGRMSAGLEDAITIVALASLLVFCGYGLAVNWRSIRKK